MTRARVLESLAICLLMAPCISSAAIITFDDVVIGETSFGFDGDGDGVDDVTFSTTDADGFNVVGPGPNQNFIDEPGLEGTSLLSPDLRVDFAFGATDVLTFGFALNSSTESSDYFASFSIYDADDNLLGMASEVGAFGTSPVGAGLTSFPEGQISVAFTGIAAYALFDFTSEFGRYIIDNFDGTFGSTEVEPPPSVPEPGSLALLGLALVGLAVLRRRERRAARQRAAR